MAPANYRFCWQSFARAIRGRFKNLAFILPETPSSVARFVGKIERSEVSFCALQNEGAQAAKGEQ